MFNMKKKNFCKYRIETQLTYTTQKNTDLGPLKKTEKMQNK